MHHWWYVNVGNGEFLKIYNYGSDQSLFKMVTGEGNIHPLPKEIKYFPEPRYIYLYICIINKYIIYYNLHYINYINKYKIFLSKRTIVWFRRLKTASLSTCETNGNKYSLVKNLTIDNLLSNNVLLTIGQKQIKMMNEKSF